MTMAATTFTTTKEVQTSTTTSLYDDDVAAAVNILDADLDDISMQDNRYTSAPRAAADMTQPRQTTNQGDLQMTPDSLDQPTTSTFTPPSKDLEYASSASATVRSAKKLIRDSSLFIYLFIYLFDHFVKTRHERVKNVK